MSENTKSSPFRGSITTTTNPTSASAFDLDGYTVAAWHPTPNANGPAEQLHFILNVRDRDIAFALRLTSRREVEELITLLASVADEIWPKEEVECRHCGSWIPYPGELGACFVCDRFDWQTRDYEKRRMSKAEVEP